MGDSESGDINKNGSTTYGATDDDGGTTIVIPDRGWYFIKYKSSGPLAEFLGTFVFVSFGIGSIAQYLLSKKEYGNWITVALGFGLGLTFGIIISISISGAHLNPAEIGR